MSLAAPPDQLTVAEAAKTRRSIRKYTQQPIPESDLREMLRLAGLAPSPWNVQPWRVVVVREPELKQRLMAAAFGQPQVGGAQAVLVLYNDMSDALETIDEAIHPGYGDGAAAVKRQILDHFGAKSPEEQTDWGHGISYIFLGYLLLVAQSMGYSSSPMLGFNPDEVKELLDIPSHATVPALIALGVAAEEGFPHHRHSVDRFARWR
jgi:nitroreductase